MHKISRKVNKQQFYYCLSCGKKKMVKKTRLANEKVPSMNQKKEPQVARLRFNVLCRTICLFKCAQSMAMRYKWAEAN